MANPTRVLFLVTDLEIGGTPRVVYDLATRLRAPDLITGVACLAPWGPVAGELEMAGVRVRALGATSSFQLPFIMRDFVRLARQYDVIYSFLMHANTVAALSSVFLGEKLFLQSIQTTQPDPHWHWLVQGLVERAATRIVVPTQSVANIANQNSRIPSSRITVIPNAIDVQSFVDLNLTPFSQDVTRIGFIGRLDPVKRVTDLVRAVEHLKGTELHIFGTGRDKERIEQTIHNLGLDDRVIMHGRTPYPHEALKQIDLLVLPSEAEGFGLVLIEAMAAGIPVVATDVPGIKDVVKHESTGLLVPVRSPDSLAKAIKRLINEPQLRSNLITEARGETLRRFTWPTVLAQYRQLLGSGA